MRGERRTIHEALILVGLFFATLGAIDQACPQEAVAEQASSTTGPTAEVSAVDPALPQDPAALLDPAEQEKRRRAYAGLMALVGIALAGVLLALGTVVWGRRLRRLNRKPLPSAELKQDLWFLRPEKPAVGETLRGDREPPPSAS